MDTNEGLDKDSIFCICLDPVRLFWYQDFSGSTCVHRLFKFKFSSEVRNNGVCVDYYSIYYKAVRVGGGG